MCSEPWLTNRAVSAPRFGARRPRQTTRLSTTCLPPGSSMSSRSSNALRKGNVPTSTPRSSTEKPLNWWPTVPECAIRSSLPGWPRRVSGYLLGTTRSPGSNGWRCTSRWSGSPTPAAALVRLNAHAGLRWHAALSAEKAQAYKPSAAVYQLAIDAAGCPADRVLLVAAPGWDLRGAQAMGMRTAYVQRPVGDPPSSSDAFDWRFDGLGGMVTALTPSWPARSVAAWLETERMTSRRG
jgi:hypothetical protein